MSECALLSSTESQMWLHVCVSRAFSLENGWMVGCHLAVLMVPMRATLERYRDTLESEPPSSLACSR
jgi:hypothetical protein